MAGRDDLTREECRVAGFTAEEEKPKQEEESQSLPGAKRKADAESSAAGYDGGEDDPAATETKFVEMPRQLLAWILSQERETGPLKFSCLSPEENEENRKLIAEMNASMQETQPLMDNFFEFQAWVRDKYRKNGRVMVPEDFLRGRQPTIVPSISGHITKDGDLPKS